MKATVRAKKQSYKSFLLKAKFPSWYFSYHDQTFQSLTQTFETLEDTFKLLNGKLGMLQGLTIHSATGQNCATA